MVLLRSEGSEILPVLDKLAIFVLIRLSYSSLQQDNRIDFWEIFSDQSEFHDQSIVFSVKCCDAKLVFKVEMSIWSSLEFNVEVVCCHWTDFFHNVDGMCDDKISEIHIEYTFVRLSEVQLFIEKEK